MLLHTIYEKKMKKKVIKFGEDVEGYNLPVLNEREIRASAGILFLFMFISLMLILFNDNFLMIKYFIIVFLADMLIRVFVNPRFSPLLIIGRLIVSRQVPEYVGAAQKKFAWNIGVALASLMFILLVIVNSYSIFTIVTCFICLIFLFFESAFGICLGCIVYSWLHQGGTHHCAGEVCSSNKKQDIQKVSSKQLLILFCLFLLVIFMIFSFNHQLDIKPKNLWEILK